MNIKKNRSLLGLNTFGVDSVVAHYLKIATEEDLYDSFKYVEKNRLNYFLLGGGSNILFTSRKYNSAAIHIQIVGMEILEEDDQTVTIECAAGEIWDDLVAFSVAKGLGGIENMSLIPGTVGAAPIQNIGAYGQELKDTFVSAKVFLTETKKTVVLTNEECKFDYRDSIFKRELKNSAVIISVTLRLKKHPKLNFGYKGIREIIFKTGDEKPTVSEIRDAIIKLRREKLPDPEILGNAGSFFKNPEILEESFNILQRFAPNIEGFKTKEGKYKLSAAKLIELSGWKGRREGNCGVSENHSLVLVNYGGATGSEIASTANKIIADVFDKFGIKLAAEVNFL
ncbi:UDP-N-acetylmuramate dehydrogenase [Ignavibacteriales bacterium]